MIFIACAVVLLLVVLNGLFSMTELAVVSSRKARLQARADKGDRGAKVALALAENPTRFLSAVQVGITLIGVLIGAYGQATIAGELDRMLASVPAMRPYSQAIATGVVVVALTYLSLIVGELVPKRLAMSFPEAIAGAMAPPISLMARALHPFVTLLTVSTSGIMTLLRVKDRDGSDVTQEEVETMLAEGTSAGLIEPEEQTMIEEIMRLGDRPVKVAMTPRREVYWISLMDPPEQQRREIRACPYSRIVVSREEDNDNPVGVVHKKDLLDAWLDTGELDVAALTQTPLLIPETTSVLKALEQLKRTPLHMAFVIDEYGAFEGVVTAIDLLEMIAGDFPESHDDAVEADIVKRADGSWLVDGRTDLEELDEALHGAFEDEGSGYHTAAGMVLHHLARVPNEGEVIAIGRFTVEVIDMDDRRIDKLLFTLRPAGEGETAAS